MKRTENEKEHNARVRIRWDKEQKRCVLVIEYNSNKNAGKHSEKHNELTKKLLAAFQDATAGTLLEQVREPERECAIAVHPLPITTQDIRIDNKKRAPHGKA
jgi:hypothetical protein